MSFIKQFVLGRLIRRARPYLRSFGVMQTAKLKPALVWEPGGKRVLVLAPHFDDESIGCGGALAKHSNNGAHVTVVFMTDGSTGSKQLREAAGIDLREQEQALSATRKQEAQQALKTLGIQAVHYLDVAETQLASTKEIQQRLRQILLATKPEVVYVPFFLEEHPDHVATNQVLFDSAANTGLSFMCCGYEVWTPLFPNCLVDITDVREVKQQAIAHYTSQLKDLDYQHMAFGLNAYRAGALLANNSGYAEAFFMAPLPVYRSLYKETKTNAG